LAPALRIVLIVLLLGGASCEVISPMERSTAPPAGAEPGPEYRIGPGDRLRITVVNHPELSVRRTEVAADGTIEVPRLGRVHAAGLTSSELEDFIRRELREFRAYRSVFVIVETEEQQ